MNLKLLAVCSIAAACIMSACSSDHSHANTTSSSDFSDLGTTAGGSASSVGGSSAPLGAVLCDNPISLNDSKLTPLTKDADFPTGNFKLQSLQMYTVNQKTNESFALAATAENNFDVTVDCNGIQQVDGSTDTDTVTGSFQTGNYLIEPQTSAVTDLRVIEAKFVNGKPVIADTKIVPNKINAQEAYNSTTWPLDPIRISQGVSLTIRFYSNSPDQIDIRVKFEYAPDQNGNPRVIEYGRAVYVKD